MYLNFAFAFLLCLMHMLNSSEYEFPVAVNVCTGFPLPLGILLQICCKFHTEMTTTLAVPELNPVL